MPIGLTAAASSSAASGTAAAPMMGGSSSLPVVGSIMDFASNLFFSDRQNKENAAREDRARQWNLEQWHRTNEYNSPKQQMERLREAGLNPNLLYGKFDSGQASLPAPGKAAPTTRPQGTDFERMFSIQRRNLELQKEKAQIEYIQAQTQSTRDSSYWNTMTKGVDYHLKDFKLMDAHERHNVRQHFFQQHEEYRLRWHMNDVFRQDAEMKIKDFEAQLKQMDLDTYKQSGYKSTDPGEFREVMKLRNDIGDLLRNLVSGDMSLNKIMNTFGEGATTFGMYIIEKILK